MEENLPTDINGYSTKQSSVFFDYAKALALAILIALFFRHFVIEAYRIPSDSMIPNLRPGDYIFVNKLRYFTTIPFTKKALFKVSSPKKGDVVVFESPKDSSKRFIKRVIGLPGDRVQIFDDHLEINGETYPFKEVESFSYKEPLSGEEIKGTLLQTNFANHDVKLFQSFAIVPEQADYSPETITVDDGHIFVLGDNLRASVDSRHFGQVPVGNLKGKAFFVAFSWDKVERTARWSRIGEGVN